MKHLVLKIAASKYGEKVSLLRKIAASEAS